MRVDYSVTWNEVKKIVDELIHDGNQKMAMIEIEDAVETAWNTLCDELDKKYEKDVKHVDPD